MLRDRIPTQEDTDEDREARAAVKRLYGRSNRLEAKGEKLLEKARKVNNRAGKLDRKRRIAVKDRWLDAMTPDERAEYEAEVKAKQERWDNSVFGQIWKRMAAQPLCPTLSDFPPVILGDNTIPEPGPQASSAGLPGGQLLDAAKDLYCDSPWVDPTLLIESVEAEAKS